ncbi:DUF4082 domain-containing protein [Actinosynnema sp. NPDC050436]|uniref:DUF4082 domain-containing protein n=1 Tax=Actinosynnema sp. NPDC050436 TaxID=3155659 RepID=UPI0033E2D898
MLALVVFAAAVVAPPVVFAPVAVAAPCDPPVVNKVLCENLKEGALDWQVPSRDDSILGFTTDISATPGEQVQFKMLTNAPAYTLDIFRLGYYGNRGARYVDTVRRTTSQTQPPCLRDGPTALNDCGNWAVSVTWTVPADAVSGIYYARVTRDDNGLQNEIVFIVRDDTSRSKVLFQTSDSTWAAYNRYGGNSLYFGDGPGQGGQAYKVSYNRPYTGGDGDENFIFNAEFPMLKFLERNGYDLSYTTDVDTARRGHLIKNHQVFMAVGHDEYWSNEQRANVEAAREAGVHLAFLTGNEIFWKTRWEKSIDGSETDWRTLASFKETKGTQSDGLSDWTGTWRDPRYPDQDGGRPENALLGNIFSVNGRRDDALTVPAAHGKMRLWRHTDLKDLAAGTSHVFQPGTLGYEWNKVPDNGEQPAGVAQLSRTTVDMHDGPFILQNHGDLYAPGTETHAITYYKHPSGSLVFGAGTVQWAWGLDDEHAFLTNTPTSDIRMQQATVNVLADMGVQAGSLMPGLTQDNGITDTTAPVVTYTDVPTLSTVGGQYTFKGSVTDAHGQVAGVEVSTDGGVRWHPAAWQAGQTTWQYTYTPSVSGPAQLRVRAVDDSVNLSAPVPASPGVGARTCPCGIFADHESPKTPDNVDGSALELGVKWRASTDGYVRGVRFYKGPNNTGTHTGTLWGPDQRQLATGTFVNETASGWQTLLFPIPVAVSGGTTYVVSYLSPTGHFSADTEYFSRTSKYLEPLTGLQSGVAGRNGVFRAGAGYPDRESSDDSNYWVDVLWAPDPGPDTRAPELTGTTPQANAASVALSPTLTATYDEAVNPGSLQFTLTGPGGAAVAGTSSVTPNGLTAQFKANDPLTPGTGYTASVRVRDAAGNQTAAHTWSFTTGALRPASCPCTVWDDFVDPSVLSAPESTPVELGAKIRFDGKGEVLGVRFYKGPGNGGTHTGSLWSSDGLLLATGTFTGETASGWQTLTFTAPVVVQANTTYVVSYFAPQGHYSATPGHLSESRSYNALRALASGVDGPNGLYRYNSTGFPTSSHNATNYWVDAIYRSSLNGDTTPPTLDTRTPSENATGVPLGSVLSLGFSEAMDPASTQIWLEDPGRARLDGTVALSGDQKTVTWTPTGALKPNTTYKAFVLVADVNGNAMASTVAWTFTTTPTPSCPCSLFSTATVPDVTAAQDTGLYELGVRFTPTRSGRITGVKFYKGLENTGTHTGTLWTRNGALLATGTFTGETASGWQTLTFAQPVVVAPGLTYVASYTAPTGRYAINSGYFQTTDVDSPPLKASQTGFDNPNGVFMVGGGFPNLSHQGNNYWVDVDYVPSSDTSPPAHTGHTPLSDAVAVGPTSQVTASFDEPIDLNNTTFAVTDPGGATIQGSLERSADQQTAVWKPAAPLAASTKYSVTVVAADAGGNVMVTPVSWSFTTVESAGCPCSLFSEATLPTIPAVSETAAYELGVRFTPSVNGFVTGVKFYKGTGNSGQHTGSVWALDGTLLKTGTFGTGTDKGWQTLTFDTPLAVTAGTQYIASYLAPNGHYAVNEGYFAGRSVTSPPLTSPATVEGSLNGLYRVGAGFPNAGYQGNHYWVDVVFTTS